MASHLLVLLFFTAAAAAAAEVVPSTLDGPLKPVTVSFDTTLVPGSDDLPADDPRFKQLDPLFPEQISVSLSTPSSVWVSWVTGEAQLVAGPVTPLEPSGNSIVLYSTIKLAELDHPPQFASGSQQVYSQEYPYEGLLNYTSGIIHHARLTGLLPSTTYYYLCGDGINWSSELNFTTLPNPGATNYPARIAIVGDLGLTSNSTATVEHVIQNNPDLFVLVGDLCYADNYVTNGTGAASYSTAFPHAPTKETHQRRWDYFGRYMQKLISRVPMMIIEGNHEIEPQINNKIFESYSARFVIPAEENGSPSNLFYSFQAGGIHFIMLGSYAEHSKSSEQYAWLVKDLAAIDRSITPWVITTFHAPWYSSYKSHYREGECMRQSMEELLYKYKVDMVFSGHVHAYERMNKVYNYTLDPCGPVYITVGDGGNIEKVQRDYADNPGMCPRPEDVKGSSKYLPNTRGDSSCLFNFTEANNQFCWSEQPPWSALRDPSFGHGILEVKNQTHALWTWHRNQDAFDGNVVGDHIYIVRQPEICLVPTPSSAPSVLSVPAATPPASKPAPVPRGNSASAVVTGISSSLLLVMAVLFL